MNIKSVSEVEKFFHRKKYIMIQRFNSVSMVKVKDYSDFSMYILEQLCILKSK